LVAKYWSLNSFFLVVSILGTPSTIPDSLWYPDTGATHHITNDSNNI